MQSISYALELTAIAAVAVVVSCTVGESGVPQQGAAVTKPHVDHADLEEVTPPDLDTVTERDVWIPMRDGTRLVADITLPVGEGPWPTLLLRTPYGRGRESPLDYAKRGYVSVVQACRGRDGSEGQLALRADPEPEPGGRA